MFRNSIDPKTPSKSSIATASAIRIRYAMRLRKHCRGIILYSNRFRCGYEIQLELLPGGVAHDSELYCTASIPDSAASSPGCRNDRSVTDSQPVQDPFGAALLKATPLYNKRRASAADLKFLQRLPQTRAGTSNRKAALELDICKCPLCFRSSFQRYEVLRTSEAGHLRPQHE